MRVEVLIKPILTALPGCAEGRFEQLIVDRQVRAVGWRMPQGITKRPAPHIAPFDTRVHQQGCKFSVLAPPTGEALVVTVDAQQVRAPDAEIAAANASEIGAEPLERVGPAESV